MQYLAIKQNIGRFIDCCAFFVLRPKQHNNNESFRSFELLNHYRHLNCI